MHGSPVGVTWTHLGMPALSGSSRIVLKEPVSNWPIGFNFFSMKNLQCY